MNDIAKGPEVPFPLKQTEKDPGVPFPWGQLETTLCRDCPFPMKPGWPDDVMQAFEKWRESALSLVKSRIFVEGQVEETGHYTELMGKRLEVVLPGGGAQFIDDPNRIVISIDDHSKIQHISVGRNIQPSGGE